MLDGSTIVRVIAQRHPEPVAVIVAVDARSPARKVTLVPLPGESVPPPLTVHVAGPGLTVSVTSSPTPIVVRARSAGTVAVASDVIVHCVQEVEALLVALDGFEPLLGLLGCPLEPVI